MREFKTESDALKYAETLGKYESNVVLVNGKRTFLSSTILPIEEYLRDPIEKIVEDFIERVGVDGDTADAVYEIGAEIQESLEEKIGEYLGIKILSPCLDF